LFFFLNETTATTIENVKKNKFGITTINIIAPLISGLSFKIAIAIPYVIASKLIISPMIESVFIFILFSFPTRLAFQLRPVFKMVSGLHFFI